MVHPAGIGAQDPQTAYAAELAQAEAAMARQAFDQALQVFKRASDLSKKTSAEAHLGMARAHHGLRAFGIQPIPTYVLLDHDGIVRATSAGWSSTTAGWLDSQVKKYLKARQADGRR